MKTGHLEVLMPVKGERECARYVITSHGIRPAQCVRTMNESLPNEKQVEWCKYVLRSTLVERSRTAIEHSYSFKHRVEELFGHYISNGAAIQAAVECGYKINPIDRVCFGDTCPSDKYDHTINADIFVKWTRLGKKLIYESGSNSRLRCPRSLDKVHCLLTALGTYPRHVFPCDAPGAGNVSCEQT